MLKPCILKTTIALALAVISAATTCVHAQTVHNAYGNAASFSDIALVYAGNTNRNAWTKSQLAPYVTHVYADGTEKWLFDAFLFLEFVRTCPSGGNAFETHGFGNGMGGDRPATQADWQWILDEYFADADSGDPVKLAALDVLVGEKTARLGAPLTRRKVVVVCPAPKKDGNKWSEQPWGVIGGDSIALDTEENRLAAVKWYIDELVDRWQKAGYANIDLEGIYWIEEGMISNAGIIADVNDYARSKGLRSYWIPYYRSGNEPYCRKWQSDFGFDMCYFQPNYAFYQADGSTLPLSQLENTCRAAYRYGAGVEIEFETSGKSNALHSADAQAHQRINDYMDVYTTEGVFDNAGVAYYVGSRGLNDMAASTDPVDHNTMDRMASIIAARQQARYDAAKADTAKAVVTRDDRSVTYTQTTDAGTFSCEFSKCMANDLFTFHNVMLDGEVVNSAEHSDNIGPFLVEGRGWSGGNHLGDGGERTAETVGIEIAVDGEPMPVGSRTGKTLQIVVTNRLSLPDGKLFTIEKIRYLVAGNSIEVWASHRFKIAETATVDRYYGMQSMCCGENSLLVPGAEKYNRWFEVSGNGTENAIKIKKKEVHALQAFIEKSGKCYQAAYMLPEGLGSRGMVADDDFVFVGDSYGKSYHKLMGRAEINQGDIYRWHGVYSWFRTPLADTFAIDTDSPVFEYPAYLSGKPVSLSVDNTGTVTVKPIKTHNLSE